MQDANSPSEQGPRILLAGEREAGTLCAYCGNQIELGDPTAICAGCGAVHHVPCWRATGRCSAYECSPGSAAPAANAPTLTISRSDLQSAEPLAARTASFSAGAGAGQQEQGRRWNKASVWAFVLSLIGIPLFGLVTGLVAIVVACVALAGHSHNRRGLALAVLAMVIGLAEVLGWAVGLRYMLGTPHTRISLHDLSFDLESLEDIPEHIARAMRANVVIESSASLGRAGLGSGVILRLRDGLAYIVTNRHVVDHSYTDATDTVPTDLEKSSWGLSVMSVGQLTVPAKVEWIAPFGVDLAVISAPILTDDAQEALWNRDEVPHIGDPVFAVGNPHGLGWTHSAGDISQIRRRTQGAYSYRVLQTTAAINMGNSGGGLYDADGNLIGINTLTGDKSIAEGLGFSIDVSALWDLIPARLRIDNVNREEGEE